MKVLYATTNSYKLLAANTALKQHSVILEKMSQDVPEVAEIQSDSQNEVAIDKAQKYYALLKQPLIVMDSGLFIEGLKGFPGVYTKHAVETIGVDGLIALIQPLNNRRAYTERIIVYTDGTVSKVFSYRCPGTILTERRGKNGRDYDFIFCMDETFKTLAEMSEEAKAKVSGVAWREFGIWLVENRS